MELLQFDEAFSETVHRLQDEIVNLEGHDPKWHKSCYASFTSSVNIQRLQQRSKRCGDDEVLKQEDVPLTRKVVPDVNWERCIFCQTKKREALHQVQSMDVQGSIYNVAKTTN